MSATSQLLEINVKSLYDEQFPRFGVGSVIRYFFRYTAEGLHVSMNTFGLDPFLGENLRFDPNISEMC